MVDDIIKMFYFTFSFIFYVLDLERKYSTHTTYRKKFHMVTKKSIFLNQKKVYYSFK